MTLSCDCHVHVFDPGRYPYSPVRKFTPGTASADQLARYLDQAGMARVVLVQPSVYGADNRCLVDALARLGGRARGVAVVSPDASAHELQALTAAGVVGARLNRVVQRSDDAAEALSAVALLDAALPEAWHLQLHVSLGVLAGLSSAIARSRRRFVLDHLGLPAMAEGTRAPLWQQMLTLVKSGQLCVKLSGPYLSSTAGPPYADLRSFVESLAQTNPEGMVWGSNWPHTQGVHRREGALLSDVEPFRAEDPAVWPEACARWLGHDLHARLHRNAAELYGFPQEGGFSP